MNCLLVSTVNEFDTPIHTPVVCVCLGETAKREVMEETGLLTGMCVSITICSLHGYSHKM